MPFLLAHAFRADHHYGIFRGCVCSAIKILTRLLSKRGHHDQRHATSIVHSTVAPLLANIRICIHQSLCHCDPGVKTMSIAPWPSTIRCHFNMTNISFAPSYADILTGGLRQGAVLCPGNLCNFVEIGRWLLRSTVSPVPLPWLSSGVTHIQGSSLPSMLQTLCGPVYDRYLLNRWLHSFPPGQSGHHFANNIFRCLFVNDKFCIFD